MTEEADKSASNANLNRALKELIVAALLYRCGGQDGMAEAILTQYAKDIHGHLASYARQVLSSHRKAAP